MKTGLRTGLIWNYASPRAQSKERAKKLTFAIQGVAAIVGVLISWITGDWQYLQWALILAMVAGLNLILCFAFLT